MTVDTLAAIKAEAEAQAEQDERVLAANVRLVYDPQTEALTLRGTFDAETGPFSMVMSITELSTSLWLEG